MEKIYFYNNRKQKLVGMLIESGPKCIILSHGFTGNKESQIGIANFLSSKGYSVMLFDYSGHGESEGNLTETNVTNWIGDLNAAINFMKQRYKDIALFGFSLGGMSSLICSSEVKTTIALAPPTNFRKLVTHFIKSGIAKKFEKFIDFGGLQVGKAFLTDSSKYDMKKIMKKTKTPVLLIHGTDDEIVPFEQSEEIIEYINDPKKFVVIEGFGHGSANEEQIRIIYKEIDEWLKIYL